MMPRKRAKAFRLSDATLRQLSWLAEHGWNENATAVVETAVDRMYQEEHEMESKSSQSSKTIVAAAQIKRYAAPDWLVEPVGNRVDAEQLRDLRQHPYRMLDTEIRGWGDYNAIIRVEWDEGYEGDYLARLA